MGERVLDKTTTRPQVVGVLRHMVIVIRHMVRSGVAPWLYNLLCKALGLVHSGSDGVGEESGVV